MNNQLCKHCNVEKPFADFHKNKLMVSGYVKKCKDCYKNDVFSKGIACECINCNKKFYILKQEFKRGGGNACSRSCWLSLQPKILDKKWNGKRDYQAKHQWIRRQLGRPLMCEFCKKDNVKLEWSNISGLYKEDITDWQSLCITCHRNYDDVGNKAWITRRKNAELKAINNNKLML